MPSAIHIERLVGWYYKIAGHDVEARVEVGCFKIAGHDVEARVEEIGDGGVPVEWGISTTMYFNTGGALGTCISIRGARLGASATVDGSAKGWLFLGGVNAMVEMEMEMVMEMEMEMRRWRP